VIDTGWEQWADAESLPEPHGREFADSVIEFLQKKPAANLKWRVYRNTLVLAVRGDDGTILAFRAQIQEERTLHAE